MNKIEYPDQETLNWWTRYIQEEPKNIFLKRYLPRTNKEWEQRIMSIISLVKMAQDHGYTAGDLHHIGAKIFYKINKAHGEIDGNKRSSIIVIYLFYLLNNYFIAKPEDMRVMAKLIAKSKGRRNQNSWISKIEKFFSVRVGKLD